MKRGILFILCSILTISVAFSQEQPNIKFEKTTHDFGEISEEDGNATCDFWFVNTGKAPLVISRVTASCGCTTPSWTREPIAPGAKGVITATYTTAGRPGPFTKTITAYTNIPENSTIILTIKGNVTGRKKSPLEIYPLAMGDLRLKQTAVNFEKMTNTEKKTQIIEIFNSGKTPMTLKYGRLPQYMTVTEDLKPIPAGTVARLSITINGALVKAYGKIDNSFDVIVNNAKNPAGKISFAVIVLDDFSKTDAATAPKLGIVPTYLNFGQISATTQASQTFKISNSGKTDLVLRSIKADSPDLMQVSIPQTVIKPGEIVEFKVTPLAKKIKTPLNGNINIITNDPNNSIKEVRVFARP